MLKTFNVVEKYEVLLPFLESKKNQSSFICETLLREMNNEQVKLDIKDLKDSLIEDLRDEIRAEIRNEFRNELRQEIRSELRSERVELKELFKEMMNQVMEQVKEMSGAGLKVGKGISMHNPNLVVKHEVKPKSPDLKDIDVSGY